MTGNDNQFDLYRIRRKSDGKYLVSDPSETPGVENISHYWGPSGCFWKKKETIISHINSLCERWYYCSKKNNYVSLKSRYKPGLKGIGWVVYPCDTPKGMAFFPELAAKYEIVVTRVNEVSTFLFDADKLLKDVCDLQEKRKENGRG